MQPSCSCHWPKICSMWQVAQGMVEILAIKEAKKTGIRVWATVVFEAEKKNQHWITSFGLTQTVSVRRKMNPRSTKRSKWWEMFRCTLQSQQYSKRRTLPDGGGEMSGVFPHYQSCQELFCAILQTSIRTEHILSAVGNICCQKMVILSEDHVETYLPLLSQSVDHRGWEHRMHFSIPATLCISFEFRVRIVLIYLIKGQPL